MKTTNFWVRKDDLSVSHLQEDTAPALIEGQIRVDITAFALTSNNITYAAMGDAMHYWQFFPVENAPAGTGPWGRIPVWGFGTVRESRFGGLAAGERLYGYFPMASSVDLAPANLSAASFYDSAPHRSGLHPVYNQYMRCANDPFYTPQTEDLQALLRPLFITSWLIDDFFGDNGFFADRTKGGKVWALLSSASSKTAYGTAFQMAKRGDVHVVGLTSARNVAFCKSLGCYDEVLTYEQLSQIGPETPCVYIDFAGNAAFRRDLHAHCRGLTYSCSIGATHVGEMGGAKDLAGPPAVLFFAPAQIKKRSQEWGGGVLGQRLQEAWLAFVARVADTQQPWLVVEHHRGKDAVAQAYQQILAGQGDPRLGHILSL